MEISMVSRDIAPLIHFLFVSLLILSDIACVAGVRHSLVIDRYHAFYRDVDETNPSMWQSKRNFLICTFVECCSIVWVSLVNKMWFKFIVLRVKGLLPNIPGIYKTRQQEWSALLR